MKYDEFFWELFSCKNEDEVAAVLEEYSDNLEWSPLGGNESNFGVVENQQSNPVAAIVEKITNSVDAILMRKCHEMGIDPTSPDAPRSIEDAITKFFPEHKNWDLKQELEQQALNIQIIADSHPRDTANTSLIIFDDGEGQHPENFEDTFLSLLRGNKNTIHFVQGKYNMGGSGAIVFCGKKRYQLIASRRFDETGDFGFTIVRRHPLSREEAASKKNTWYEYFKIQGQIPSFPINGEYDLGLHNHLFRTGTIIKLYSYELKGNRHIRRDLSRSLNEFLHEPALPYYVVETEERYPNDKVLTKVLFGLKRDLQDSDYVENTFSERFQDPEIGNVYVTVYVFKAKAKGKSSSDTKRTIQNEFFKNNMSVLFSMNGQVHGHYTSEFITRTLKFNLLRDYLLIHVDCTNMNLEFRNELFMASRDRLKGGDEASTLRKFLGDQLKSSDSKLREIYKRRKDNISVDTGGSEELLRNFADNLPIDENLRKLLSKTFKLNTTELGKKKIKPPSQKRKTDERPQFNPKRYPSFFSLKNARVENGQNVVDVPLGGSKTVAFDTDVENQYFDRVEDPGDLQMAVMTYTPNDAEGGTEQGTVNDITDIFSVSRKSPNDGQIKVIFKPNKDVQVGDMAQIQVDLTSPAHPDGEFTNIFWVRITEPPPEKPKEVPLPEEDKIGLPQMVPVYRISSEDEPNRMSWEKLGDSSIEMSFETVIFPLIEGDILQTIYVNMDSHVLKSYKASLRQISLEQNTVIDNRYISSVYFHTLFLYMIHKNGGYYVSQSSGEDEARTEIDLSTYLVDLFSKHYASFLMSFEASPLIDSLD